VTHQDGIGSPATPSSAGREWNKKCNFNGFALNGPLERNPPFHATHLRPERHQGSLLLTFKSSAFAAENSSP